MATDFNTNAIASGGGFKPSPKDTPTRIGERIETLEDITSIPNPWVGMIVYVRDIGKRYEVLSIKDVQQGLSKVSRVDQYRELPYVDKEYVDEAIENAQLNGGNGESVNLEDYAKKEYVDEQLLDYTGGKKQRYVTQAEYDVLSEEEKNDIEIVWNITDAEETDEGNVNLDGYAKIEDIPTKLSELENDSNFMTQVPSEYITETKLNNKNYATQSYVTNEIAKAQLNGDGDAPDLSGFATKDDLNNKVDKVSGKSLIDDAEIERLANVDNYDDTELKNLVNNKADKSELFSKDYNDLTNKPDIPTKTSQLTNDNAYATETFVNNAVGNISTHGHSNKSILDAITQDDIDKWNSSQGNGETANLDTLALEVIDNELSLKDGENVLSSVELPTNENVGLEENSITINELSYELKSIKGKNLLDPAKYMPGTLSTKDGSYSHSDTLTTTDFIAIDTNKTYYVCVGKAITIHGVAFYDVNKQFISYVGKLKPETPEGACYLRLRITSTNVDTATAKIMLYEYEGEELTYAPFGGYEINPEYLPIVTLDKFEGINENGKIKDELIVWKEYGQEDFGFLNEIETYEQSIVENKTTNLLNPKYIMRGTISSSGVYSDSATNITTDFIKIDPTKQYSCLNESSLLIHGIAYYDADKVFISYNPDTTPENASYLRLRINTAIPEDADITTYKIMLYENTGEKPPYDDFDQWQIKENLVKEPLLLYIKDFLANNGYLTDSALGGLKWYVMGDSISCKGDKGYQGYVSRRLGLNRVDKARMGNHMTYNNEDSDRWGVLHELRTFDMADADIITILIGTNDWANYELGDLNKENVTETTFFGAMNVACQYLVEHWIGKRIGFMTPPKRDIRTYDDDMKTKFENLVDGMIEICSWYSIPILNLWKEGGLASDNDVVKAELIEDGLHPNTKGHAILARPIEQFLKRL